MARGTEPRVLIVVFDALRPEFVTPELMPNLHAFAAGGVRYLNSHSTFPSETRVNQSAVTTGCYPRRHGVVANRFVMPQSGSGAVLDTGDDIAFEKTLKAMAEPLFGVLALGQRLAQAGKSYATLSSGTAGGGRLINIMAEDTGSFRLAMRRPDAAWPKGISEKVVERVGPMPEHELPAIDWIRWAVDAYLDFIEPEVRPDVMLLWLSEPDETFHQLGIGSPESLQTITHVDAQFGRILERHRSEIDSGVMQIVTLSDHGQITVRGEPLGLAHMFEEAGFEEEDISIAAANAGGVWLREADPAVLNDMVNWLQHMNWCGPVFTRDGAGGTLTLGDVLIDHERAPDIALALAYEDASNEWDRAGMTLHASKYPSGGGCHGGLSPYEMHNFLAMSGSHFKSEQAVNVPAGNIDILPTVLHVLGMARPDDIDGRVLHEALKDGSALPDVSETTLVSTNAEGSVTHLSVSTVSGTPYINRAWVE